MIETSIIVPAFKRIAQTVKSIQLLLSSMDESMELIVSDCTPDNSLEKELKHKFGNAITYLHNKTKGISSNKNRGVEVARGKIIIFCDTDIEVRPNTLTNSITSLKKTETAAGLGIKTIWKHGERDGQIDRPESGDRVYTRNDVTYTETIYSRYFTTYKSIFLAVGKYDEDAFNMSGEGADLSTRYWRAGFPLVYDSAIETYHIADAGNSAAVQIKNVPHRVHHDWTLLQYKYNMYGKKSPHFESVVKKFYDSINLPTPPFTQDSIQEYSRSLDTFRKTESPLYPFPFLEVFSDLTLLNDCIDSARNRISSLV